MLELYFSGAFASFILSVTLNHSIYIRNRLNFGRQEFVLVFLFALFSWFGFATQIIMVLVEAWFYHDVSEKLSNNKIVKFIEGEK